MIIKLDNDETMIRSEFIEFTEAVKNKLGSITSGNTVQFTIIKEGDKQHIELSFCPLPF